MNLRSITSIVLTGVALQCLAHGAGAQEISPAEEKLREALKAVTLQLRTAESDKAVAQAEKSAAEARNTELTVQVEQMGKQLSALSEEKAIALDNAAREQSELSALIAAKELALNGYRETLDKWRTAHAEISTIARKKEAERVKCVEENAELVRRVADLRSRNLELFKTANEILDRYRKYSLGEALSAREPFTGINRVKLQNLIEGYHDQILDQTEKP